MCIATRLRRHFVVGLALCALSTTARADWFEGNDGRGAAIYYSGGNDAYYPAPYPQYGYNGYNGNAVYLLQQAMTNVMGNRGYSPNPVYYGNGYYNAPSITAMAITAIRSFRAITRHPGSATTIIITITITTTKHASMA